VNGAVIAAVGAAGVIATAVSRALSTRRAAQLSAIERARTFRRDGVYEGAESVTLAGSQDRVAMLLHGFNDTPQSLAILGRALHERGWTVHIPLLPHHGRGADAFIENGNAAEWISHARSEWLAVQSRATTTLLVGQSMGGAIASILAVEMPPTALVLLAPYLSMGAAPRALARVWPVWQLFVPQLRSNPERAIRDPAARARSLGGTRFSPRLVSELLRVVRAARRSLAHLSVPTLVIHGRSDYRIPSASAQGAFDAIGSRDKTLLWQARGGHVIAADEGHEEVIMRVAGWLDERVIAGPRPGNTFDTMGKH
jgi:carboxylesterase